MQRFDGFAIDILNDLFPAIERIKAANSVRCIVLCPDPGLRLDTSSLVPEAAEAGSKGLRPPTEVLDE